MEVGQLRLYCVHRSAQMPVYRDLRHNDFRQVFVNDGVDSHAIVVGTADSHVAVDQAKWRVGWRPGTEAPLQFLRCRRTWRQLARNDGCGKCISRTRGRRRHGAAFAVALRYLLRGEDGRRLLVLSLLMRSKGVRRRVTNSDVRAYRRWCDPGDHFPNRGSPIPHGHASEWTAGLDRSPPHGSQFDSKF